MAKDSFADMFARGEVQVAKQRTLRQGDQVEGVVAHISADAVFLDLDDKQQAFFERIELEDLDKQLIVKLGDRVSGFIVSTEDGQTKLAKRFGKGEVSTEHLQLALNGGVAVEGKVVAVNKGGLDVEIGGIRAFCPASQIDNRFVADTSEYVGKSFSFAITKLDGKNVVVSRRTLLEREAKESRERVLAGIEVGSTMKGKVTQTRDFGVFVDLGGIEGLIPMRELSHDRGIRAEEAVQIGDVVEVQVKNIEKKTDAKGREKTEITLSLKALAKDPWENIEMVAPIGRVIAGQVTRTADFGAFVRLASGIEGLLHISELGTKVQKTEDVVQIGAALLVRVVSVDPVKKRVGLALASDGATAGGTEHGTRLIVGSIVKAVVEKVETYGVVVQISGSKGRSGRATIPNAETNTRPGADLRKDFPVGKEVSAKVLETSESRTRLSIKAALDDAERADFDTFRAGMKGAGMGTFGDLLKAKIGKK
jgi:small subunit ribosomal protein S1